MNEQPSTILLNGSPHPLAAALPLPRLLEELGLAGKPVVVELDARPVLPGAHAETLIHPGARLEIITLAAGG